MGVALTLAYPGSQNFIHTQIPLAIILPHLSKQSIVSLHQVHVKSRIQKSDLHSLFNSHNCMSHMPYFSVFLAVDSKLMRDKICKSHADAGGARTSASNNTKVSSSPCEPTSTSVVQDSLTDALSGSSTFPPNPADPFLTCDISQNFCKDFASQTLEEAGCAVCSQLTPMSQLTRLRTSFRSLRCLVLPE